MRILLHSTLALALTCGIAAARDSAGDADSIGLTPAISGPAHLHDGEGSLSPLARDAGSARAPASVASHLHDGEGTMAPLAPFAAAAPGGGAAVSHLHDGEGTMAGMATHG